MNLENFLIFVHINYVSNVMIWCSLYNLYVNFCSPDGATRLSQLSSALCRVFSLHYTSFA